MRNVARPGMASAEARLALKRHMHDEHGHSWAALHKSGWGQLVGSHRILYPTCGFITEATWGY